MSQERRCGSCVACCCVPRIEALGKPARTNCVHLKVPRGPLERKSCTRYETRPRVCQDFRCLWITTPEIPRHWRPNRLRLLLTGYVLGDPVGQVVVITEMDQGAYDMRIEHLDTIMRSTNWPTSALIIREDETGKRYLVGGRPEHVSRYVKWGDGTADADPKYLRWVHRPVFTG